MFFFTPKCFNFVLFVEIWLSKLMLNLNKTTIKNKAKFQSKHFSGYETTVLIFPPMFLNIISKHLAKLWNVLGIVYPRFSTEKRSQMFEKKKQSLNLSRILIFVNQILLSFTAFSEGSNNYFFKQFWNHLLFFYLPFNTIIQHLKSSIFNSDISGNSKSLEESTLPKRLGAMSKEELITGKLYILCIKGLVRFYSMIQSNWGQQGVLGVKIHLLCAVSVLFQNNVGKQ